MPYLISQCLIWHHNNQRLLPSIFAPKLEKVHYFIDYSIDIKHELHFDFLASKCNQLKDAQPPVNMILLRQLLAAAMTLFARYYVLLVQAIFICAYSFSMRVGEYTENDTHHRGTLYKSHNILPGRIKVGEDALGIVFQSYKTFCFAQAFKHRAIQWLK